MTPTDAFYTDAVARSASLSAMSKRTYASHLRTLQAQGACGHSIDYLVRHPTAVYALICAKTDESMSRMTYISTVLTLYRQVQELTERYPVEHAEWRHHLAVETAASGERYLNNKATSRQLAAHVPWPRVLEARDALPRGGQDHLLMSMYTRVPPLRCDLDRVRLYTEGRTPTQDQQRESPNYLLIDAAKMTMTLVLGEFKTKKEHTPEYRHTLPPNLTATIRASLELEPREYLLVQPRFGDPFPTADAYTKHANKVLRRVLGNPVVSISSLRHSFLTWLPAELTVGKREQVARLMTHSFSQQARYIYHDLNGDKCESDFEVSSMDWRTGADPAPLER